MKKIPAKVGSLKVRPGRWSRGNLRVARLDGGYATIPLLIAAGPNARPGSRAPIGLLAGGAHGNEPNGPELVHRVLSEIEPADLQGVLLILPLMNPWGFNNRTRMVPMDQRDLNRSYPGHASGSFTLQVANTILESVVSLCDFVIDAHDAGDRIVLVSHARVHDQPQDDPSLTLGLAFGSDVVMQREAEPGMLAREARNRYGTTVVSLEVGGAMRVWEDMQEQAKRGVVNMLRSQGLMPGQLILPPHQHILRARSDVPAEISGVQTNLVRLGDVVKKGTPLYRIVDPLTGEQVVHRSKQCGVVLAQNLSAAVELGMPTMSILSFSSCDAESVLKSDVVHNRSDRHVVVVKGVQGWAHQRHTR